MRTDKEIIKTVEHKKEKTFLDYEDFKNFVAMMSTSQGYYGRLYRDLLELEEDEIAFEELREQIKDQHFTDVMDFIYWLEC